MRKTESDLVRRESQKMEGRRRVGHKSRIAQRCGSDTGKARTFSQKQLLGHYFITEWVTRYSILSSSDRTRPATLLT